jgi:hypothetical protein
MATQTAQGANLKTGDTIVVFGRAHRIREFRAYERFSRLVPGHTARIAVCDTGLEITVEAKSTWQVAQ